MTPPRRCAPMAVRFTPEPLSSLRRNDFQFYRNTQLAFIEENEATSVGMTKDIIGCPHEEGIDYPEGESCPTCRYWKGRDRLTHEMLH